MSTDSHGNLDPTSGRNVPPTPGRNLDPTLRRMFGSLVERVFYQQLGVYEPGMADYLADVLTDFVHVRQLYKVRDLSCRPLEEVADMLLQADIRFEASSFNREREVHKHIGDYTLFWTGIYPESLPRLQSRWRKDHLIDYVQQGKNSYAIASSFDHGEYHGQAMVMRKLAEEFELCVFGLNNVRHEMDRMRMA